MKIKKNRIIEIILASVILLTGGYALISSNLEVTGTADATLVGNVEVLWVTDAYMSDYFEINLANSSVSVSVPRDVLILEAELESDTAYMEVTATIENTGTLDAIITDVYLSSSLSSYFTYTIVPSFQIDQTLAVDATLEVVITLENPSLPPETYYMLEVANLNIEYSVDL